ncbi:uroporphyrinogen decarboxylase family protein [Desulfotruncus alcoholivorax]|uniref:uroporphyrinogen decarboxylase family protein n=1 Tax=Desulfotruncus alcoholivorax TaxID=265477 RepID=UPI0003FE6A78|nr:uroporphyrinogen decarboxylase family protein [Desulfotruncus alcoholivorax]
MKDLLHNRLFKEKKKSRVPRGELWISGTILEELGLERTQKSIVVLSSEIDADICFLSYTGPVQQLPVESKEMEFNIKKAHDLELLCGVTVDGPFERIVKEHGFLETMKLFYNEKTLNIQLEKHTAVAAAELAAAEKAGADLLILCDDIAYTRGLYFSPHKFKSNILPLYQRLRNLVKETAMGFHSDGNVESILDFMIDQGYSVFSLEPEAMDLITLSRALPENITLLSGIKAEWLMGTDDIIYKNQKEILNYVENLSDGCSLILSSLCGLSNVPSLNNLKLLYDMLSG